MIEVRDTGIGMDEATLSHLFEPFFTTKDAGRGVGLGTSVVYGFVRQNGGHIHCDSAPGKGTSFRIYFPEVHATTPPVHEPMTSIRAPVRAHETILLVEDDDAVRKFIRGILRKDGYTVVEARSGAEALSIPACQACQFQLLLTDVVMPDMSGTDLAIELLQMCPATKVIFLSGYMEEEMVRHGVATGAATFLQKPFPPAVLLEKIHETLHEDSRA
jgi:CheY-like chemotaxis protein